MTARAGRAERRGVRGSGPRARADATHRRRSTLAGAGRAGRGTVRGAGQQTVRRHNLALVLDEVAAGEPVSRAGVAARTGLTRGTVSSLVEQLLAAGLLTELAATRGGTGRPANPLQLNRSGPAGLGLEIGVEHVGACVVDLTGAVRARRSAPSAHRDRPPAAGLDAVAELAAAVVAEAGLADVRGRGGAARRDRRRRAAAARPEPAAAGSTSGGRRAVPRLGGVRCAPGTRPTWPRWPSCGSAAAPRGRLPVRVLRDRGRRRDRAGRALFRGAGGRAGELGHVVVDPDGARCSCGGRGCLEQAAGQQALLRATGAATVARAARTAGRAAVETAGRALGIALAGAVHLLDVRTVVLGGLYAQLGEPLRPRSRRAGRPGRAGAGAAVRPRAPGARCEPPRPGWSGTAAALVGRVIPRERSGLGPWAAPGPGSAVIVVPSGSR